MKIFNKEKRISVKKIIKIVIVIIFILLAIFACILYKKNESYREVLDKYLFRKEVHEYNLPYIEIDSSKVVGINAYDRYICILHGNKLELYNRFGNNEGNIDLDISMPIFESKGNYLAVGEKNGQRLYFINGKNLVWQKEIEGKINSINVNKNGYVSVTILGTSYKTVVKTYDKDGNELFTKYIASASVVATDISNDNKYLAIAEVNFSGIVVQSTIEVISIDDAKNNKENSIKYTHIANSGDLITNIKYQNKNKLVCMYDEHIDILDDEENETIVDFKNEDVLFADINFSSKVIKIMKNNTGLFNSEIIMQIIDTNSKSVVDYNIKNVPKSITVKDDTILINLGTETMFIKENGWLQKKYESSHEIQNIVLCSEVAGIVSKNKVELISL